MKRLLTTLAAGLKGSRKSRPDHRAQLGVESLEARQLLSASPITDMTLWAQQFAAPSHAQTLWVNFDGKHNEGQNISAFVAQPGQNRDAAIQDVLYRVEEIFSPFNVQVRRRGGDGSYLRAGGDTTVFVGGDLANLVTTKSGLLNKFAYSQTSFGYSDYATAYRGVDHAPNSDPYDLSFVDPMVYSARGALDKGANSPANWTDAQDDASIAQDIAHEAGHTFGLAHVLASPLNDIMSYNSGNQYFINKAFSVTDLNNTGTATGHDPKDEQPLSHVDYYLPFVGKVEVPVNITTQNSFTFLQTVLGKRYWDGYSHISDSGTVDASTTNPQGASFIGPGTVAHGALGRIGDSDAYVLYAAGVQQYHLDVAPDAGTNLYPSVMVKDGSGNVLFFNHAASSSTSAHIDFQSAAGQTYFVVVGSEDTSSSGGFTVRVTANVAVPVLTGATFTFSSPALGGALVGRLVVQSEDVNSGSFSGVYYDFLGMGVPVWGKVANTVTTNGVSTSDFSFNGSAQGGGQLAFAQYSGKLTGKGSASGNARADTVDGTLVDQVFLMPTMSVLWSWAGSAKGKDF